MNQAISPIEDKDEVDLTCWIQAAALRMESDAGFSELLLQVVDRIKAAGLQVYALSIYLLAAESKSDTLSISSSAANSVGCRMNFSRIWPSSESMILKKRNLG